MTESETEEDDTEIDSVRRNAEEASPYVTYIPAKPAVSDGLLLSSLNEILYIIFRLP